ncbi:response regulator [Oscillibacter sp.]|uniref:response regulator n=1 Tax=Oscillibacter sp. TaxID=1945593 RepID=UPI0028A27DA5|nr:response regulator [Oscillibacter sp.]
MLRVFLVEDESIIRETLRDTVPWGQYGYTFAGEAGDGELALPMIRQTKPDVLITDIRMPFMDGLALSKLVLSELPKTKVIIISGYDDFEYAHQAIDIGVEQFLLKPVTKSKLLEVLEHIREKIESERVQGGYLTQFHVEAQEYEQYARRRFFEQVVAGQLSIQQIYEQADRLDLDLRAQCYTIAFFSILPEKPGEAEHYSEPGAQIRDALLEHFLKYPEYILLRWNLTTYAVLLKGDAARMPDYIRRCIDTVQGRYTSGPSEMSWYVAVGTPTQRLSMLPSCFEEVSRLWAYRHIVPERHVLTTDTVDFFVGTGGDGNLMRLDAAKANPSILLGVMRSAGVEEIPNFVDEYLGGMAEALESKPFCQYLMLSARFTAAEYAQALGCDQETFLESLGCLEQVGRNVTVEELKEYLSEVLIAAADLRDKTSNRQYHGLLQQAVRYLDQHYMENELSLNRVAQQVNISPNYLSAVFSQEMGCTLTEYLTEKRMEKARELLRSTTKRSGEIAFEVGYKDAHYFSFLFKKSQGCTPRDYRAGRGKP